MAARDPHRYINELDEAALQRLVARLESRAMDAVFAALLDKYVARLKLRPSARLLEVGCGTGANLRKLARCGDFKGESVGVDQCQTFIDAAWSFARTEGVGDRIMFQVGDAHHLDFPSGTFDAVIAHTLISHAADPALVIKEMARVVRPGGMVVVFDGDYSSLTFGYPDHDFGSRMDAALANATFNNPRIMRDLPRLLSDFGLELVAAWGDAVTEIGNGSYFKSFAETYVPYVIKASLLPQSEVENWMNDQQNAMEDGKFFACCNYYTYMVRRQ